MQEKCDQRSWWLQYQCELNPQQYVKDESARRIAQVNKKVGVRSPQKNKESVEYNGAEVPPTYRVGMKYQDRGMVKEER
jgi:hypothetical protein